MRSLARQQQHNLWVRTLPLTGVFMLSIFTHQSQAADCRSVAQTFVQQQAPMLNAQELGDILVSLQQSQHKRLPTQFVTKQQAKQAGWRPGQNLWSISALYGKSIGGDHFGNFERKLPQARYKEADLAYNGKRRGAYRFVFASNGTRFVTLDHYQTFKPVPSCQ